MDMVMGMDMVIVMVMYTEVIITVEKEKQTHHPTLNHIEDMEVTEVDMEVIEVDTEVIEEDMVAIEEDMVVIEVDTEDIEVDTTVKWLLTEDDQFMMKRLYYRISIFVFLIQNQIINIKLKIK